MLLSEPFHKAPQPNTVFDNSQCAVRMYDRIVPGWHDLASFLFGHIPGRRYIAIGSLEGHKSLNLRRILAPYSIRAGYVPPQRSERTWFRVNFEWNMVRAEPGGCECNQGPERMSANELVQHRDAQLFEVLWNVHVLSAWLWAGRLRIDRRPSLRLIVDRLMHQAEITDPVKIRGLI